MTEPTAIPSATAAMRLYIHAAILLSIITMIAVVVIAVLKPEDMSTITVLVGLSVPATTALIAAGIKGMGVSMDGRMEQLLDEKGQAERLKGLLAGLRENPATNLNPGIPPDTGERRGGKE